MHPSPPPSPCQPPAPPSLHTKVLSVRSHSFFITCQPIQRSFSGLPDFLRAFHRPTMPKVTLNLLPEYYPYLLPVGYPLYTVLYTHYASFESILLFEKNPKNIAQGGALPKRDIVDPKTHASCATGPNMTKQFSFPTTWGKAERVKVKGLVKYEIQVTVTHLWPQWTVSHAWTTFM